MWLRYLFLSTCHVLVGGRWQETHIYRLERDLLSNYSPTVRPVLDVTSTINVSVTLYIMSIYEIDEMSQSMAQNSYMSFKWIDEFLQWDPDEYGGLQSTELPTSKIWLPFTEVVNSVSGSWVISPGDAGKVIARATGHVTNSIGYVVAIGGCRVRPSLPKEQMSRTFIKIEEAMSRLHTYERP
ncbi:hypothetical protein C0Q70_14496 [Pomacea canaliculata]|uniref:Neurotransmitter-gated ion-channel ligand-binding domain-containing protein n=1 Tax=Pomacea canaliculata TaxID=400727 RepID=A0A2T7NS73_POMCA|nr:hypothetical protein C0Q70_14496 [Pomacea canaliculata]